VLIMIASPTTFKTWRRKRLRREFCPRALPLLAIKKGGGALTAACRWSHIARGNIPAPTC